MDERAIGHRVVVQGERGEVEHPILTGMLCPGGPAATGRASRDAESDARRNTR